MLSVLNFAANILKGISKFKIDVAEKDILRKVLFAAAFVASFAAGFVAVFVVALWLGEMAVADGCFGREFSAEKRLSAVAVDLQM